MTNETTASQPTDFRKILVAVRESLQFANDTPNGGINDTIWMMHGPAPETVFDFIDAALEGEPSTLHQTKDLFARQPKSIGDDAQFFELVKNVAERYTSFMGGVNVQGFLAANAGLNAYVDHLLDSRAPPAQASATIQAAPEGLAAKVRAIAEKWNSTAVKEGFAGNEVAYELLAALGDFDDAATIQEPVMVAEPVGEVQPNAADLEVRQQVTEALGLGRASNASFTWSYLLGCIKDAVDLAASTASAAPMVADPAGVALPPLPELESLADLAYAESTPAEWDADYRSTWQKLQVESRNSMQWRVYALKLRDILAVATVKAVPSEALDADDVQWVVNDNAELGVKIGNKFFFLYKGSSLVYGDCKHDNGEPMMWRPVFKREFGECAHPINHADYSKIGTVSLGDSDEWKPLYLAAPLANKTGGAQ